LVGGGHAQIPEHHKRDPGFFAIRIQEHFEFDPSWYHGSGVRELVLEYYYVLRSVLRRKPHLRPCVSRCRHCGIFFLTHPRNAGRRDLRCPFGCREAHRRKRATQRSTAYYQTENGKVKKKRHNAKRGRTTDPSTEPEKPEDKEADEAADLEFDEGMVEHLRVQTSLIEEREVTREETIEMLKRVMRQRSMAAETRRDYVVRTLKEKEKENPP